MLAERPAIRHDLAPRLVFRPICRFLQVLADPRSTARDGTGRVRVGSGRVSHPTRPSCLLPRLLVVVVVVVIAVGDLRSWVLVLPWERPPLSLNDRMHWQVRGSWVRNVRDAAHLLAIQARVPALARCRVELVYAPRDRRTRDSDNLVATLKPLCDGLVDAGVVPDDSPGFMVKPMPRIVAPQRPARLELLITELPAVSDV